MRHELYFISSIFHLLIAALVLASRPDAKALLVFIRFDKKRYDALLPCCSGLVGSAEQLLFIEDGNKSAGQRKRNAKRILAFAQSHQVEQVFVGNDRHVEFQYVAYHLRKSFSQLRTAYLDEGLFSYIGRKASQSFADKWIDQTLKKLVYGAWWHSPPTIGASKYIDEAWLAYPDLACSVLQARPIVPLPLQGATSPQFQAFIGCWAGLYDLPAALDDVDYVLTITDEKNFSRFPDYSQSIRHLVEQLVAQGKTVVVKYHPNANGRDLLNLAAIAERVMVLPSAMPFEVLLPLLSKAILIAEFSSTLMTSRLLRPDMTVWSIRHAQQNLPPQMQRLLGSLEIESLALDEIRMKVGSA